MYHLPLLSVLRGARVVHETDSMRAGKLQNLLHERGFARTGRPGNDQDQRLRLAHSMFCTCSRSFSISDLISSASSRDFQALGFVAGSLRKQGVGFALHFLQQKIELLADVGCAGEQGLELLHVAARAAPVLRTRRCARRRCAASCARRAGSSCASPSRSFSRDSSRRANAGRARSARASTLAARLAMLPRRPDISSRRAFAFLFAHAGRACRALR